MPSTEAEKKAMKKYHNEKRKKIACDVSVELYEKVKEHILKKGYQTLNSYVLNLINEDLKK